MSVAIHIESLVKRFGDTTAVDALDLVIQPGELFFLLGPSGCGKTTLLRMLAGLETPTSGRIRFGDRDVTTLPANKRNIGMMFQSYALWPHMNVAENVAFGLKVRKIPTDKRDTLVREALEAVQMQDYAQRRPGQLSGGQQQRVALARAVVIKPDVLLLDEPLSNLDAALRIEMRREIRRLCRATGITSVYVTHDQEEALSMADRMAVLRKGSLEQLGPPRELYANPNSSFVAGFLGETNFIPGTVTTASDAAIEIDTAAGAIRSNRPNTEHITIGTKVVCSIRPEAVGIDTPANGHNLFEAKILDSVYLGGSAQRHLEIAGGIPLKAVESNPDAHAHATTAKVSIDPAQVVVLPD